MKCTMEDHSLSGCQQPEVPVDASVFHRILFHCNQSRKEPYVDILEQYEGSCVFRSVLVLMSELGSHT